MTRDRFEAILSRLLEDQELSDRHPFKGQFGRTRDEKERMSYQKDDEPLQKKPQFFMTFNAVQCLCGLLESYEALRKQRGLKCYADVVRDRRLQIQQSLELAGDFAERLLVRHGGLVVMQGVGYHDVNNYVSYRHTVGAAIVLLLLRRCPELVQSIVSKLASEDIQNTDGGWPIADKVFRESDLLCSAHVAFLFRQVLDAEPFQQARSTIKEKLDGTMSYFVLQAHRNNGFWVYENEDAKVPFTARTYPELFNLLREYDFAILYEVPQKLLECCASGSIAKHSGIRDLAQLRVRLGYVFRMIATVKPAPYVERYLELRRDVLSNYSSETYLSAYELCCLLTMMTDQTVASLGAKLEMGAILVEPVVENMYFVGNTYRLSRDLWVRLKDLRLVG